MISLTFNDCNSGTGKSKVSMKEFYGSVLPLQFSLIQYFTSSPSAETEHSHFDPHFTLNCGQHVFNLFVQTVGDGSSSRLVDDTKHVESGNHAGVFGGLTLRVIKVGGNSYHGV